MTTSTAPATMPLDRARRITDTVIRNANLTTTEVQALRALIQATQEKQ